MDSNWLNPEIILMIYAAIVSTISLVWNITLAILEKCSRLTVSATFNHTYTISDAENLIEGPIIFHIRIVNKGNSVKYISEFDLQLPYKADTGNKFTLYNPKVRFPIEIQPQQEYIYKFTFVNNPELMLRNYVEGKFRIIVFDTIGKKYKSNKINTSEIKKAFKHNNTLSPMERALFDSN